MLTSLFTGTSGLQANMDAMSVIGDNLANMNTIGYKGSRVTFSDMLAQNLVGGFGSSQIGMGVSLSNVSPLFQQGSLEATGSGTDLAIEGNGFFMVRDAAGVQHYTRAGQFNFDKNGYMINPEGYVVKGYAADGSGVVDNVLGDVKLSFSPVQPKFTEQIDLVANLNSDADIVGFVFDNLDADPANNNDIINTDNGDVSLILEGGLIAGESYTGVQVAEAIRKALETTDTNTTPYKFSVEYNALAGTFSITSDAANTSGGDINLNWAAGTSTASSLLGFISSAPIAAGETAVSEIEAGAFDVTNPIDTSNFSTAITVFDSLGNAHQVAVYFRKDSVDAGGNTWEWFAVVDEKDSTSGKTEIQAQGSLDFTNAGALNSESIVDFPDLDPPNLVFGFNFAGGATQNQQIGFDFGNSITEGSDGLTGMTQYGQASSVFSQHQDGYTVGNLQSIFVDTSGVVTGIFSNGITRTMAQLALAQFTSPENLRKVGGNLFLETVESGQALISTAGASGLGSIHSNALELSTVDISEEFVRMITAQRGFQANSRVITTADEMLAELVNLKR